MTFIETSVSTHPTYVLNLNTFYLFIFVTDLPNMFLRDYVPFSNMFQAVQDVSLAIEEITP